MNKIQDQFTNLKVSRQRKKQMRWRRDKLCIICGDEAVTDNHCLKHAVNQRERQRNKNGAQKRYKSLTYRRESVG